MLSDYPKLNIFKFLSSDDLKKASLVCKDWRKLIFTSSSLLSKLTITVTKNDPENAEVVDRQKLFLQEHGQFFSKLLLTSVYSETDIEFIFKSLRNVKHLTTKNLDLRGLPDNTQSLTNDNFPKLETLVFDDRHDDRNTALFLQSMEPSTIQIISEGSNDASNIQRWITSRKKLTNLELHDYVVLDKISDSNTTFRLKSFTYRNSFFGCSGSNLLAFLQKQSQLEIIYLDNYNSFFAKGVLEYIFFESNVHTLTAHAYVVNFKTSSFDKKSSLRHLKLLNTEQVPETYSRLFPMLPKLRTLQLITQVDFAFLKLLADNLPYLEKLELLDFAYGNYAQVKFQNLTELTVNLPAAPSNKWAKLLVNNPQLKTIGIRSSVKDKRVVEAIVQSAVNLEVLLLKYGVYSARFLNLLRMSKPTLQIELLK